MLKPKVELVKEPRFCTCGAPNFRSVQEWNKPIYKIYKVTIPKSPCGGTEHYLCEYCIKEIVKSARLN